MAEFPTTIPTFRALENLPHATYNETQKKTIFAEDMTQLQSELLAVMSYVQQLRTELDTEKAKQEYKVGDIFLSFNATDPATVKGYGTWVLVSKGRTLVGVDAAQTEFNTVRKSGGAKTQTLTIAEMPAHNHDYKTNIYHGDGQVVTAEYINAGLAYGSARRRYADGTESRGGGGAHNNLQPYLTCYIWERTA